MSATRDINFGKVVNPFLSRLARLNISILPREWFDEATKLSGMKKGKIINPCLSLPYCIFHSINKMN